MLKIIAVVLLAALALVLTLAALKPNTFRVERSVTIIAPPDRVYPLIADFHRWDAWSPWEKLDPAMKRTFGGASSGRGATYAWEGNKDVGKGRMEITDTIAPSRVAIKLDFLEPFETHNVIEFTLKPQGNATTVNWTMQGPNIFLTKLMQVFVSMDRMVGKDFETGLANLKALAER